MAKAASDAPDDEDCDYRFLAGSVLSLRALVGNGQGEEMVGGRSGHKVTDILAIAEQVR